MRAGRRLPAAGSIASPYHAPVAQLDRVSASEAEGRGFESRRAHHFFVGPYRTKSVKSTRRIHSSDVLRYSARPFSQSRPLNAVTAIDSIVPPSMQRALTLIPSGWDRGT